MPAEQIDRIIDGLAQQFKGCSDEGITKGQWLGPKEARLYRDESRRISVVCENSQLSEAQEAVIKIGQELGQLAMYFEVRDFDGVQFLEIPRARRGKRKKGDAMKSKAQQALLIARELAKDAKSSVDFHNALFGIDGKFGELFPMRAEREAFLKTQEYREISRMRAAQN